jgi:hypothetical protein
VPQERIKGGGLLTSDDEGKDRATSGREETTSCVDQRRRTTTVFSKLLIGATRGGVQRHNRITTMRAFRFGENMEREGWIWRGAALDRSGGGGSHGGFCLPPRDLI